MNRGQNNRFANYKVGGVDDEHALEVLDDLAVALGRGRGVEDDRVRHDRSEQHRRGRRARLHPVLAEALDHERGGRSDRVERRGDRDPGFDRADVVMVEDLDDLGLLDARHALSLLGVVDEEHAAAGRRHEVGPRHEADRPALRVDHHRGAVVALLDLLGDVGHEELGRSGQRFALHQRAARRRERDHPAGHVAVERRHDHRRAVLAGKVEDVVGRGRVVREHDQLRASLDRHPLGVGAVADHDHVAVGDAGAGQVHRLDPHPT